MSASVLKAAGLWFPTVKTPVSHTTCSWLVPPWSSMALVGGFEALSSRSGIDSAALGVPEHPGDIGCPSSRGNFPTLWHVAGSPLAPFPHPCSASVWLDSRFLLPKHDSTLFLIGVRFSWPLNPLTGSLRPASADLHFVLPVEEEAMLVCARSERICPILHAVSSDPAGHTLRGWFSTPCKQLSTARDLPGNTHARNTTLFPGTDGVVE